MYQKYESKSMENASHTADVLLTENVNAEHVLCIKQAQAVIVLTEAGLFNKV